MNEKKYPYCPKTVLEDYNCPFEERNNRKQCIFLEAEKYCVKKCECPVCGNRMYFTEKTVKFSEVSPVSLPTTFPSYIIPVMGWFCSWCEHCILTEECINFLWTILKMKELGDYFADQLMHIKLETIRQDLKKRRK